MITEYAKTKNNTIVPYLPKRKNMYRDTLIISICAITLLTGWSTPTNKTNGAHIYGIITTQQGNIFENAQSIEITDGKETRKLVLYELPQKKKSKKNTAESDEQQDQPKTTHIPLTVNPQTELATTQIDLIDIKEIHVLNPEQQWVYKKEKGFRETPYIEVGIIKRGSHKIKSYLIERSLHLQCKQDDTANDTTQLPIIAIKKIVIVGYTYKQNVLEPDDKKETERIIECTEKKSTQHHNITTKD